MQTIRISEHWKSKYPLDKPGELRRFPCSSAAAHREVCYGDGFCGMSPAWRQSRARSVLSSWPTPRGSPQSTLPHLAPSLSAHGPPNTACTSPSLGAAQIGSSAWSQRRAMSHRCSAPPGTSAAAPFKTTNSLTVPVLFILIHHCTTDSVLLEGKFHLVFILIYL